jgi:Asp-tRNA(Asn)/Glu-tRNA(Gln) amidotransferase C subunit
MTRMTETQIIHIGSGAGLGDGRHETDPLDTLFAEIANYLEAVDAFRREGHEPTWRAEVPR